jgi:preprotein translocase subunit SecG
VKKLKTSQSRISGFPGEYLQPGVFRPLAQLLYFPGGCAKICLLKNRGGDVSLQTFLVILQVIFALGLIASVLLQSGKSAGISGAIAGGAETLFGRKKGLDQLLGKVSAVLAMGFLLLTLLQSII